MFIRIAWRNLFRQRLRTWITTSSITFCLAIVLFFIALAEGFYQQMVYQAVRIGSGHITLEHAQFRENPSAEWRIPMVEDLGQNRFIEASKPLVVGSGVLSSGRGAAGIGFSGTVPEKEREVSSIVTHLTEGEYLTSDESRRVMIGRTLADRLEVGVGKKVVLTATDVDGNLVEQLFRIKGIFGTGVEELDAGLVQMTLFDAQKFLGYAENEISQLAIVLSDADRLSSVMKELNFSDGDIAVRSWHTVMPELAAYIRLDRSSNLVFQGLLVVLILFTIFSTLVMSVVEREREFAMLMAIGTTPRQLQWQVFLEAGMIGILGGLGGLIIGGGAIAVTAKTGIDFSALIQDLSISGVGVSPIVHPHARAWVLVGSTLGVVVSTLLLSLVPIARIPKIAPTEILS